MLTVFLKLLLCMLIRLLTYLCAAASLVIFRVERKNCSPCLPFVTPNPGLIEGQSDFERHMNLRLFTGNCDVSLHPGLCEHSPTQRWQVDFRRFINPPLFGDLWPLQRTCLDAGTV